MESTFGAVKAKFGASLRCKTPMAMVNETLFKLLCYNITTLIHSMYEFGISPVFFDAAPAVERETTIRLPKQAEMEWALTV